MSITSHLIGREVFHKNIVLTSGNFDRYAENGSLFSELFARALRDTGTLCLAVNRLVDVDGDEKDEREDLTRVVIGAPDNDMVLQSTDHIIALVQHREKQ